MKIKHGTVYAVPFRNDHLLWLWTTDLGFKQNLQCLWWYNTVWHLQKIKGLRWRAV